MNKYFYPGLLITAALILTACGPTGLASKKVADFSNDDDNSSVPTPTPYIDKFTNAKVNVTQTQKVNQEFPVTYKTSNPDGTGKVIMKAKSFKSVDSVGGVSPDKGKKLYLLEIAVKGFSANKGEPSTFNQVGDTPSPQFVLVNKSQNKTFVEETYFSDAYTQANKLFELSKLTTDGDQWVNTAIVFQVDASESPTLAFRFINAQGQLEFYDITQ